MTLEAFLDFLYALIWACLLSPVILVVGVTIIIGILYIKEKIELNDDFGKIFEFIAIVFIILLLWRTEYFNQVFERLKQIS